MTRGASRSRGLACALLTGCLWLGSALADTDRTRAELNKYREMLQEGNPAEFAESRGEELWTTPAGPKKASLEQCDLGLGPGRVEGAYAQLPRWFADTGRVQDLESRLVTCMTTLQGYTPEEATRGWYRADSNMEALVSFVAGKSRGVALAAPNAHPEEANMRAAGEALFFRRSGPLDFSCATCHSLPERRIRLQEVRDLLRPDEARDVLTRWPAYRVSRGQVWTLERRLMDCMRQMRWPEPAYMSDALIALQVFLHQQAAGGVMQAPGMKR
jgi:sulfur-oxidizing protein SoxA